MSESFVQNGIVEPMKALIDTNILIDSHAGLEKAAVELNRYTELALSRVSWIEFFAGARTPEMRQQRQLLIDSFELLEVNAEVAEETVRLRQTTRLRLPDAMILATARVYGLLLVTRNTKDFSSGEPDIRIPY